MKILRDYKLIEFDEIDSTNLQARRMVQNGEVSGPVVITAKSQTQGRGRLDRSWVSVPGNLFVSIIKRKEEFAAMAMVPFIAAISIGEALRQFAAIEPLYKWPNDVLVQKKKISGVLIEVIGDHVIIGIGVNIASFPPTGTKFPATCLNDQAGKIIDIEPVLQSLILHLDKNIKAGGDVGARWMEKAYGIGQIVSVAQEKTKLSGRFLGIDENGWLILQTNQVTREAISFGDVSWI